MSSVHYPVGRGSGLCRGRHSTLTHIRGPYHMRRNNRYPTLDPDLLGDAPNATLVDLANKSSKGYVLERQGETSDVVLLQ